MKHRRNIQDAKKRSFSEAKRELTLLIKSLRLVMESADNADAVLDEFSSQGTDLTEAQIREFYHKHGVSMSRKQSQAVNLYLKAMDGMGGREAFLHIFKKWLPIIKLLSVRTGRNENICPSKESSTGAGSRGKLSGGGQIKRGGR